MYKFFLYNPLSLGIREIILKYAIPRNRTVYFFSGGSNGGTASPQCNASRDNAPVNGVCGSAIDTQTSTTTYAWLPWVPVCWPCSYPSACNSSTLWSQIPANTCCAWVIRTCSQNTTTNTTPSSNLCVTGTPSAVTGSGPWSWTCNGIGWWSSASCSTLPNAYPACSYGWQILPAWSTYPGCNTPDKLICTWNGIWYVWSMCNVGSTIAGTTSSSYGSMFQWWRNVPFLSSWTPASVPGPLSLASANATSDFITSGSSPYDWLTPSDNNRWWGVNTNTSAWVYYNQSAADKVLMQWPCAAWYHVPTFKESYNTLVSIYGYPNYLSGGGDATTYPQTVLQLPKTWYRFNAAPILWDQWNVGGFWLSSTAGWNGSLVTHDTYLRAYEAYPKAYWFPVRCIKN